jgi:hypothetical protein
VLGRRAVVEPGATGYQRRRPEDTVLHQVVRDHLEAFLADARVRSPHGCGAPRHVERELRGYLRCGLLAHGFIRTRCAACGFERLVAFACKGRAVCPSCRGRRMTDLAAQLVDRVLPVAPYRQWTLSVPWALRPRLAHDRALLSRALAAFIGAIFRWQRAAARARGVARPQPAAVTAVQRFGSALNLNVHYHVTVPDGVFVDDGAGGARFVPLPPPTDDDVAAVCARAARRIRRLVDGDEHAEPVDDDHAAAASLLEAARAPLAPSQASLVPPDPSPHRRRTAAVDDFSLHADTAVPAHDRAALERLLRYGARPPFAHQRLRRTAAGKVAYRLRRPWFTGQTELVLEPLAFLRRLAALVPPPRQNQTRYHGVFAAHAKLRRAVTALVPASISRPARAGHAHAADDARPRQPSRLPWAELFRRVFRQDLEVCPRCAGDVRVLAAITDPDVITAILDHLDLPTEPPSVAPARAPPQLPFWPDGVDPVPDLDAFDPA